MSLRTRLAAVTATLVALTLTACAGLPVDGPVHVGRAIDEVEGLPDFSFVPDGPVADATPQQVVEGFIAAGSGPRQNWATAQEFLTREFRETWKPQAGVIIHAAGDRTVDVVSDEEIVVNVDPVATVDDTGAYEPSGEGAIPLRYELVLENEQWRIAQAPDGIVLDANRFSSVFRSYSLAYFDPKWRSLVPDVRWFPATNPATRITDALVTGPKSPWLASSVQNAFPEDVSLTQPSVPVDAGVAQVSLDASARDLSAQTLSRMQAQLEASLADAGILKVQMLVGDEVLDVRAATVEEHRVEVRPLVLAEGRFGFLSGSELEELPELTAAFSTIEPESIELDADRTTAAVRTTSGAVLRVASDGSVAELDTRAGLTAPSIDPFGHIWTVPSSTPAEIVAYGPDGSARTLAGGWTGATAVSAMRVSRDGTRVAALVRDGVRSAVWVAGIVRDDGDVPVAIGEPHPVATLAGDGIELTWLDDATVALVWTDGEQRMMREQPIGGEGVEILAPAGVVSVAGGNQPGSVRLRTAEGALFVQRGSWQILAADVDVLAVQQGTPD
ncbi:LpqB family beta-propeller domain-containing protein [Microbacterium dauci]|uniref:LpqB family beta-propeller domain-containing protein n=1 Tax=Microbacterium dauci TaxID=3048008 RepID=A0ABT6Z9W7_9MICO|nr:LpqB family beta-propeller domain-containing protein [Microbacterium sp. LX3-4]MDJ1112960.1 LpqB family beta-propeller domain-containing protein [Microbacterium sp. LX3-4]